MKKRVVKIGAGYYARYRKSIFHGWKYLSRWYEHNEPNEVYCLCDSRSEAIERLKAWVISCEVVYEYE